MPNAAKTGAGRATLAAGAMRGGAVRASAAVAIAVASTTATAAMRARRSMSVAPVATAVAEQPAEWEKKEQRQEDDVAAGYEKDGCC